MSGVVVAGAGVMGASAAYWLTRLRPGIEVTLVERDRSFSRASSSLSASSVRQQFSSAVNVRMSLFGAAFLEELGIELAEHGYLYLGRARALAALREMQAACGANIALLDRAALAARFPWLEVADVEAGTLGLSGEGWFDGPALHRELLRRARAQGARLVEGEVAGFDLQGPRVTAVRLADGSRLACGNAVNAAGPWAGRVAAMAGIDLSVRARRRTVFVLSSPAALPCCPLVVDPAGFWFRPEGRYFLAGAPPSRDEDDLPLEPDLAQFEDVLWPAMARRVPAFEALRVERAWAGYYDMHLFDQNAVIGAHPAAGNLWHVCGFSGHGMQHAPAAGRGIAELVLHEGFRTLDLAELGFDRVREGKPLVEANVIG